MGRLELGNEYGSENIELFGNTVDHKNFENASGSGANVQDYKPIPLKIGQKYQGDPHRWTINLPPDFPEEAKENATPAHGENPQETIGIGPGFGHGVARAGATNGLNSGGGEFEDHPDPYTYDYGYKGPGPQQNIDVDYFGNTWVSTVESMYHLAGKSTVYESNTLSLLVGTDPQLYSGKGDWQPVEDDYANIDNYGGMPGSPWANAISLVCVETGAEMKVSYSGGATEHLGLEKSNIGGLDSKIIEEKFGGPAIRTQTVDILFADGEKTPEEKAEILEGGWGGVEEIKSVDIPALISATYGAIRELNQRLQYLEAMHCLPPGGVAHCPPIPSLGPILARLDAIEEELGINQLGGSGI